MTDAPSTISVAIEYCMESCVPDDETVGQHEPICCCQCQQREEQGELRQRDVPIGEA